MVRSLLLLLCLLLPPSAPAGGRREQRVWDRPFSQDTKAIQAEAQAIAAPEGQSVVVLLEEHDYKIDKTGRTVSRVRKVLRILHADAVEGWGSLEQEYAPWYESRPEFRARVIRADGSAHWLDPKTIADSPAQDYEASIYSDRRVLRAPLPGVVPGAVIEQEVVIRESAPLLDAGVVRRITVPDFVPIERFRLSAEAANGVPLLTASRNMPAGAVRQEERGGHYHVEVELGPLAARKTWVANLPAEESLYPYFSFSNGKSWNEVAVRYAQIVDRQIASANLQSLLEGLDRRGSALEIAAQLTAKLHREVRYTGVEFREAAIVPRTPAEVLQRKYGDCKDKAALLVAMLRMVGLRADVALLNAGLDTDADAGLPGLGLFNHAIVYVQAERAIWIDATSPETRVGDLPLMDQNRLALIAHPSANALIRTPGSQAGDNRRVHSIEVRMNEFGSGEFVERVTATGYLETQMRETHDSSDEKNLREAFEQYVKRNFQAKSVGEFSVTRKDDFSAPFQTTVRALQSRGATTAQDDAAVVLHPYLVFEEAPYPLREAEDSEDTPEPRKHDFVFHGPHQIEYRYTIHTPRSFRPQALPASEVIPIGPAQYSRSFRKREDGTVEAVFQFDSGKPRVTAVEFETMRRAMRERIKREPEVLTFVSEAAEHLAVGNLGKALRLVRSNAAQDRENPAAQVRLARMLVTAGDVDGAITTARKITEKAAELGHAWQALGWAYQHDSFGRRFKGNWNRAQAERCYREALKLNPDDYFALIDLAILLEHNPGGRRYGKGAQLDEAITLYRTTLKSLPDASIQHNLALALLYAGRYPETREEIRKLPRGPAQGALSLVVTAITDGAARAIIESQTTAPDSQSRAQQLLGAGQILIRLRQHSAAAELMKVGGRLINMGQLSFLDRLKPREKDRYPASDPRHAASQFLQQSLVPKPDGALLRSLYARRARPQESEEPWVSLRESLRPPYMSLPPGFDGEDVADFGVSVVALKKTGEDDRGYRIEGEENSGLPPLYMILEDGQYRVLGHNGRLQGIGELALELLERKDVAGAQWWLDTIVADLHPGNPFGSGSAAARLLWSGVTAETRGPEAIRTAAASLIGRDSGSPKAIAMLRAARAGVTVDLQRAQIDLALCESLERAHVWKELLVTGRRLASHKLFVHDGFRYIVAAAEGLKDWTTLKAEAHPRLQDKNNAYVLRAMARAMVQSGDRQGAVEYFRQLSETFFATEEDRVTEAWNLMLIGKGNEELLERLTSNKFPLAKDGPDSWYTVGMLQAHLGQADEALRSLNSALDRDGAETPDARAWALLGKIHEVHGLAEAAAAAYSRMVSSPQASETAQNAVAFVQANGAVSANPSQ